MTEDTTNLNVRTIGGPPSMQLGHHGYEIFQISVGGEPHTVHHHRLLALLEYGMDEIEDKVVHHENGIPWDNRVENLRPLTRAEHASEHADATPVHDKYACWALYEESELTYDEVSDVLGLNASNVATFIKWVRDGNYKIKTEVDA